MDEWIIHDSLLWESEDEYIWIPITIDTKEVYVCFKKKYFFQTRKEPNLFVSKEQTYKYTTRKVY